MHYYRGFGLNIESEIELPELVLHYFTNPDIRIRIGVVPDEAPEQDGIKKLVNAWISPTAYFIRIDGIAAYYVHQGNEIIVQPEPLTDAKSVRLFLLDNVMAALLLHCNLIPLNAALVCTGNTGVLLCGLPGAGKSALAAALYTKGYKVYCDDMSVLQFNEATGLTRAVPSYPMIGLWEDSFEKVNMVRPGKEAMLRPGLPKYGICCQADTEINPVLIKKIIILKSVIALEKIRISRLDIVSALHEFDKNNSRPFQIAGTQKKDTFFYALSKLLDQSTGTFKIERSVRSNTLPQIVDFLESEILSKP